MVKLAMVDKGNKTVAVRVGRSIQRVCSEMTKFKKNREERDGKEVLEAREIIVKNCRKIYLKVNETLILSFPLPHIPFQNQKGYFV